MIYKWETCKKCPRDVCMHLIPIRSTLPTVYDGNNFYIVPPCANNDGKFSFYRNKDTRLYASYPTNNNTVDLITLLDVLLKWSDLQLEDALQLTKIRNMI